MSSHAQTSRSHKSKNPWRHDEYSGGVNLTPQNSSKPQSSKTLFAPAKQTHKSRSTRDRDELQEPTLLRNSIKISVQPERETNNEYENEANDDFCPTPQQPFQPAYHGLEENLFDKDENASISNYQSDSKLSRRHKYLEDKQNDLEML